MATQIGHGIGSDITATASTLDSSTFSISGSNKYLRVLILSGDGTNQTLPTSVVWDPSGANQALTLDDDAGVFNTFWRAAVYQLIAPTDGTSKSVRVTWPQVREDIYVVAVAWSGVDQTTPCRALPTIGSGTSNSPTVSITTVSGDTVVAFLGCGNAVNSFTAISIASPFTMVDSTVGRGNEIAASAEATASSTTTTANWTITAAAAGAWKAFGAALIDASGGPSPGAGSLALAGQAPTVIVPLVISPGAGSLQLIGQEPQTPKHLTTPGDTGSLSYVAGESLVGGTEPPQVLTAQPSVGALTLAGQTLTVSISGGSGTTVTPSAGALVLAGQAPTVLTPVTVAPGAGALVLAGQASSILQNLIAQPGAGALTLAGQAPTVLQNAIVQPGAAALVLAGQDPTVLTPVTVAPGAGTLVLAGQTPTVIQNAVRSPGAGVLVLAGQAPTLLQNFLLQPGAGSLVLAGQTPAALNGDAKVAQPSAGALTLAGQAPTVLAAVSVQPGAGALALAGQAPTVQATQSATPGAGALVLAGQAPTLSVTANVVANPLTGALVITSAAPTAATSDNRTASPGAGTLTLSGQAPTIPIPSPTVTPDPGALFLEGLAPGILVSGDDLLSAKFIARPNVRVKGLQPEPAPAAAPLPPVVTNMPGAEVVIRKAQGLNLGLITAPPVASAPAQPAVEVPPIKATMPAAEPKIVLEAPTPAAAPPAPEPPKPAPAATRSDVQAELAQLHTQILEATRVQGEQMVLALDTLTARVEELQAQIEADAKARDLRERNMLRAKQIAERMLRDLEK